jgi:hypothetical protein
MASERVAVEGVLLRPRILGDESAVVVEPLSAQRVSSDERSERGERKRGTGTSCSAS